MLVKILTGSEACAGLLCRKLVAKFNWRIFQVFASLAPIGVTILLPPLERKGMIVQILGQAVCNTSRHVGPFSVDWGRLLTPEWLAYVSPRGALLASKASHLQRCTFEI